MKHLSLPFVAHCTRESSRCIEFIELIRSQIHGVTFPEQQRLKEWPDLFMAPMFAEDVGWVVSAMDVMELGNTCSNTFTDAVEGKGCMAFMKACMWDGGTVDDRFIITEHHGAPLDGNSEVAKDIAKIDDLFHGSACSNKLRRFRRWLSRR
jgi:hypothetical protein